MKRVSEYLLGILLFMGLPLAAQTAPASLPNEAGMYVATPGGFTRIIGQSVAFTRSGSRLVSGVTLGIKAQKENVQLLGAHAHTAVGSSPAFYFVPAKQEAEMGVTAGDVLLIRLEEEPQRRQFEVQAKGIGRESSGISLNHQIQLNASEAQPGTFKLEPAAALEAGEYALYLNRGEKLSPYLYDFSVPAPGNDEAAAKPGESAAPAAPAENGKCTLQSTPDGGDITVDGSFAGNAPSTLSLNAGKHTITVSMKGYKTWTKEITINAGSEITLKATLEQK